MNLTSTFHLRLVTRDEGKIKSHESCSDLRAWSHDGRVKDLYLREWMRGSAPGGVLPASTLTSLINTMCRSQRKTAPGCHPQCKSKVLVDSICNSFHAMRECLEVNDFEKYFVEEELETSQWPCERCLDALKNIKMFWKIILDKIFHVNISKCKKKDSYQCCERGNIRSIAKRWQSDIVSEALYVKSTTLPVAGKMQLSNTSNRKHDTNFSAYTWPVDHKYYIENKYSLSKEDKTRNRNTRIRSDKTTDTEVKLVDKGCDSCFKKKDQEEINEYKNNISSLESKYFERAEEMDKIKRENNSLRLELENVYTSCPWKGSFYCPGSHTMHTIHPKPYELQEKSGDPKKLDSEMVITMKECKNTNFKHVSLLQVLHKSNDTKILTNRSNSKNDDPIDILTKVQHTFDAIVKRELSINTERRPRTDSPDIEASHTRGKSTPSSVTVCTRSNSNSLTR